MVTIKKVFEQIEEKIRSDALQLSPGEYLPSEMQYARTLGVNRLTVRKAVDRLVQVGLVQRLPGKGLRVNDHREVPASKRLLFSLPYVACDGEFFLTMMGCIDRANDLRYDYKILAFTDVHERLEMVRRENLSAYSGAVISCFESLEDQELCRMLTEQGLPTIVAGSSDSMASIHVDDYNGGYLMGDYLAKHGHREILYLSTNRPVSSVRKRYEGFCQALRDNAIPVRPEYILEVEDPGTPLLPQNADQRRLPQTVEKFLHRELPCTALCGYNTLPILSLLNQMHLHGFRVPEDISVVAYGSEPYFAAQVIPLTAVLAPNREIGARAVDLLDAYLTEKSSKLQSDMLPILFKRQKSVRRIERDAERKPI